MVRKRRFHDPLAGATGTGRRVANVALAFVILVLPAQAVLGIVLYDVTFSSPPHVVGQRTLVQTTGTPRTGPTYDLFGDSRVVSAFGGLLDQPLHLVPTRVNQFSYAQLQFDIGNASLYGFPTNYAFYHVGMDVFLDHFGTNDTFSLILDVPGAVRMDLSGNGTISQPRPAGNPVVMGDVPFGTTFALAADIDLPSNQWTISVNQQEIYTGQFCYPVPANPDPPDSIFSFRINLSDDPSTSSVPDAAIDNIVVMGTIPEPGTFGLAATAMLSLVFVSRRLRPAIRSARAKRWRCRRIVVVNE
jgi:hypothetical protein